MAAMCLLAVLSSSYVCGGMPSWNSRSCILLRCGWDSVSLCLGRLPSNSSRCCSPVQVLLHHRASKERAATL